MVAVRNDETVGKIAILRSRRTRQEYRESLRIRAPQVDEVQYESDSSGEEDGEEDDDVDSTDDEDGEDEEDDEDEDENGTPDDGSRPTSSTLSSQTQASQTTLAAETDAASSSEVESLLPSITSLPVSSENAKELLVRTTSGLAETSAATAEAEVEGGEAVSGGPTRAAEAGIIVGAIAIVAILVAAAFLLYRRYSKRKGGSEPDYPSSETSDDANLIVSWPQMREQKQQVPPPALSGPQSYSAWAKFDPSPSAEMPAGFYSGDDGKDLKRLTSGPAEPQPPLPTAVYDTYRRDSTASRGGIVLEITGPLDSVGDGGQPGGPYEHGTPRQSFALTDAGSEATWRTWNVDQRQAKLGKGLRERYLR